jgi:1-acyl-sn-glycerol-3-phosphate acyltransferase
MNLNKLCNYVQLKLLNNFTDFTVDGLEHIPHKGPLIYIANHQAFLDPSLISTISPRKVNFLAKKEAFKYYPIASLLKMYGAHPINRFGLDLTFFRWALKTLNNDEALCLFPEGTRSNGEMTKGLPGIVHLAIRSGANIIPIGIKGTNKSRGIKGVLMPSGKIEIKIGKSFKFEKSKDALHRDGIDSILKEIMNKIAELLPNDMRGVYR